MRKTVEIEYVSVDDVIELVGMVNELIELGQHFASVEFNANFGHMVRVCVDVDGFRFGQSYDLMEHFNFGTDKDDVESMLKAKDLLKSLINSAKRGGEQDETL